MEFLKFLGVLALFLLCGSRANAQALAPASASAASSAPATEKTTAQIDAENLYKAGAVEFKAADQKKKEGSKEEANALFQAAGTKFQAAYNLDPSPILLYNMARAAEEQGDLPTAIGHYRSYLARYPDAKDADRVQGRIDAFNQMAAPKPAPTPQKQPTPKSQPKATPPPTETSTSWGRRQWSYVAFGGAGAAAITATVLGVMMNNSFGETEHRYQNSDFTVGQVQSSLEDGKGYRTGMLISAGIGAAALVTGLSLLWTSRSQETSPPPISVSPSGVTYTMPW